eukprot:UN20342
MTITIKLRRVVAQGNERYLDWNWDKKATTDKNHEIYLIPVEDQNDINNVQHSSLTIFQKSQAGVLI